MHISSMHLINFARWLLKEILFVYSFSRCAAYLGTLMQWVGNTEVEIHVT
jgi:hypothetical protein